MKLSLLALAGALTVVLAGSTVAGDLGAPEPEPSLDAFTVSARSEGRDPIVFQAARDPGRAVAMTVAIPGLEAKDVASARVVLKRGEAPLAGIPLGAVEGRRGATFQATAPDAGEWTSALILIEKQDRAMVIQEFRLSDLEGGLGNLRGPGLPLPPMPKSMSAPERAEKALELVVKEALLLPGPLERLLFE